MKPRPVRPRINDVSWTRSAFDPDRGMLQTLAACIAGWLAANAARTDLDFVWQSLGLLFNL